MTAFKLIENCRYGRFLVPNNDVYVGEALAQYGEYSQHELEFLLQFLTPQTRVVAVGGNIGAMVVPLARNAGQVITFEPQRWVFQVLCANVVLNNLLNVRAYWGAVGQRKSVMRVPTLDPEQKNNFGALEIQAVQGLGGDAVPVYTLDTMPDMDCGLLTIDVEGMEEDVLRGAPNLIARCRPVIFFEADRALKRIGVFRLLREWNYDLYWYRTQLFNEKNFFNKADDIWRGEQGQVIVAENVIAVPKERGFTLNGFVPVLEV